MTAPPHSIIPIGRVHSGLVRRDQAPTQGDEGGPSAMLAIEPRFVRGLIGIEVGQEILVLTWLHEANREVLAVHPRDDWTRPLRGVFATRSEDRPNPIGLHRVNVIATAAGSLEVEPLEAVDGTPVIDIKPVLGSGRGNQLA